MHTSNQFSINPQLSRKITALNFILSIFVFYIHATNYTIYNLDGTISGSILIAIEKYMWNIVTIVVPMFYTLSCFQKS